MNSALLKVKMETKLYSPEELACVNQFRFPEHVAIMMDGNRRWAKKHGLPPVTGHWRGSEALNQVVQASIELGVKVLTIYGFSTENWNRSSMEVKSIMRLLKVYLLRECSRMVQEGVRFNTIGDITKFPKEIQQIIKDTVEKTSGGESLDLVVALNYGARDELKRAVQSIVGDCIKNQLKKEELSEKMIASYLDTAKWKDPDLLIRTSGESRVSNFLLWQISYSEIVLTDVLWPDFCEKDLLNAILEFQKRERRLGKDNAK